MRERLQLRPQPALTGLSIILPSAQNAVHAECASGSAPYCSSVAVCTGPGLPADCCCKHALQIDVCMLCVRLCALMNCCSVALPLVVPYA